MVVRPEVISELRCLFKVGATPSRLIAHILAQHPEDTNRFYLVQRYFHEAFSVPQVRWPANRRDEDANGLRLAYLNALIVHQMIQYRPEWDQAEGGGCAPGSVNWLDSLAATDDHDLLEQAQPADIPELAGSWDRLDEEARKYVKRLHGNVNGLYERVAILARLAECLQQQVNALQERLRDRDQEREDSQEMRSE
jgi:hypothetical protein